MATSPHRIHHDLYRGPKILADPGDGGIIRPSADLQICEMVSGASAETRTLANPTKPGVRLVLRLKTDGGGDVVVNAANGYNVALETSATFADAGDLLSLISVSISATSFRWQVLGGQVGAALATSTASATSTATATSTSTGTPTSTSTSTQSISGSDTASGTFSASATSTSTKTATPTGTSTSSSTATPTATGTQ